MAEPGKELERAKRSRTRLRKALKDCRDLNNIIGVAEGAVQSPVADLLKAIDSFINKDVPIDKVIEGVFEEEGEGVEGINPGEPLESANAVVQEKIDEIKGRLRDVEVDVKTGKEYSTISERPSKELITCLPRLMKQSKLQRVHGDNLATALSRSCLLR